MSQLCEFRRSPEQTTASTFRVTGEVGLGQAAAVHAALVQALGQTSRLVIDLTEVTAADLTFFQILLAARRSAREQGKTLSLAAPGPGQAVRETAAAAGFPATATEWLGLPIVEATR